MAELLKKVDALLTQHDAARTNTAPPTTPPIVTTGLLKQDTPSTQKPVAARLNTGGNPVYWPDHLQYSPSFGDTGPHAMILRVRDEGGERVF